MSSAIHASRLGGRRKHSHCLPLQEWHNGPGVSELAKSLTPVLVTKLEEYRDFLLFILSFVLAFTHFIVFLLDLEVCPWCGDIAYDKSGYFEASHFG